LEPRQTAVGFPGCRAVMPMSDFDPDK
jgi:hypothetical protein